MKIFQLEPTVIVGTQGKVVKFFANNLNREVETTFLNRASSPTLSLLDSGEEIRIVKTFWQKENILVMEMASGCVLSSWLGSQDKFVSLVARLLAKRHSDIVRTDEKCEGQLLGDFVNDHLFWDENAKLMTFIDPGANFLVHGDLGEDCARYIYSLFSVYRWHPMHASKLADVFVRTYLSNSPLRKVNLERALKFRYLQAIQKYRNQKSVTRAALASFLLLVHKLMILRILRKYDD